MARTLDEWMARGLGVSASSVTLKSTGMSLTLGICVREGAERRVRSRGQDNSEEGGRTLPPYPA